MNEANWKFKRGDVCRVDDWEAYVNGREAVVDHVSGNGYESYSMMLIENGSHFAWCDTRHLTFIKHISEQEIAVIEKAREARQDIEKQLPWIVEHWRDIENAVPSASMETLMALIGITQPWGSHGEGIVYYTNMGHVYRLLGPALATGDIEVVRWAAQEVRTAVGR